MSDIDVSVVIGFKDWGHDRVEMAVTSIVRAFGDLRGEVIVSDYGSTRAPRRFREADRRTGWALCVHPHGWRLVAFQISQCGICGGAGQVLISTDADMIFSPGSLAVVTRKILDDESQAIVLQCRDLPEGFAPDELVGDDVDWSVLDRSSRLRPRWGMGGMMACSRAAFLHIRGLDERMEIYGGEDIDFANRLRRSGRRIEWIEDPRVRMYHMWHPPTRKLASSTEQGLRAIEVNRKIHVSDLSYIRNTSKWTKAPVDRELPVSVVISTFNRAAYLPDAINSVLAQTMPDFELIIVDDGSIDETRAVVEGFDDERIRYFYKENAGLAAARNFAADHSRGRFTAIHDDDDIMLPWRLQRQLETLTANVNGSYGGWVDFDNETGEINPLFGKHLNLGSLLFAGKVYLHPTLMVDTALLRRVRYNETLRSGSDYNLGVRLLRSGAEFAHTGEFHTLRRLHPHQITETDSSVQKTSAVLTSFMARLPMSGGNMDNLRAAQKESKSPSVRGSKDVRGHVARYFPDHLVRRSATVTVDPHDPEADGKREWLSQNASRYLRVEMPNGIVELESADCADVSLSMIARLRQAEIDHELHLLDVGPETEGQPSRMIASGIGSTLRSLAEGIHRQLDATGDSPYIFAISSHMDFTSGDGDRRPEGMSRVDRVVIDGSDRHHVSVFHGGDIRGLGSLRAELAGLPNVLLVGLAVANSHADALDCITSMIENTAGAQ